jgi:uncharacterized membrane-anchored protein YhcB (DUF1043 family)
MAWLMPYIALVFGIPLVVFIVKLWKGRPAHATVSASVRGAELDRFRQQAQRETEL